MRKHPKIDLTLFAEAPPLDPLPPWTCEDVLEFIPSGSAGLDGITSEWLAAARFDTLRRLALLLSQADLGRTPSFWKYGRVTLIPKGPDAEPTDLRPITVLPTTYRVWSRRHARHLNKWLASWKPGGLTGAMPDHGASDLARVVMSLISDAALGSAHPSVALSMEQEKCFDRSTLTLFVILRRS